MFHSGVFTWLGLYLERGHGLGPTAHLAPVVRQLDRRGISFVFSQTKPRHRHDRPIRRKAAPHAVGISLGAASSRRGLVRALEVVAAALKSSAARTRVIWASQIQAAEPAKRLSASRAIGWR